MPASPRILFNPNGFGQICTLNRCWPQGIGQIVTGVKSRSELKNQHQLAVQSYYRSGVPVSPYRPGDTLVLYTDGLTAASTGLGHKRYDDEGCIGPHPRSSRASICRFCQKRA